MSVILEALRKSEAERRRGEPPGLHAELPPLPPPPAARGRLPRWLWPLSTLLAITIAGGLWWRQAPTGAPNDGQSALATRLKTLAPTSTPSPAAAPPVTPPAATADASAPPPSSPEPTLARRPTPGAAAATTSAPQRDGAKTQTAPAARPKPARDTAAVVDKDTDDVLKQIEREARALQAEYAAAPTLPPPRSPPTLPNAPPAPSSAAVGNMMTLGDLDPQTRASLPPLRISMHMWNGQPDRRFAIIDGRRVREGDLVGAMTVVQIRQDGVLLDWNGRRLRLTLR